MRYPVLPVLGVTDQYLATFEPHVANLDPEKFAFPQACREGEFQAAPHIGTCMFQYPLDLLRAEPGDGSLFCLQTLYPR